MTTVQEHATRAFAARFGAPPPLLARAPGRVNLIGEHTDYNDGFVMPLAIDRAAWIALRPRADRRVIVQSLDMEAEAAFDLADLRRGAPSWVEYLKGVAWALQEAGHAVRGWEGVLIGDVPIGAGLSSSAAVEMAAARAFLAVSGLPWSPAAMARIGQAAENRWLGVNSGIMDQMISAAGRAGHALLIDCRSLETEAVPLPPGTAVVVLDTGTRRGLVDSAYNERRAQCEAAAAYFGVPALRDVDRARFANTAGLDETARRRAWHVVGENERVLQARAAMARGDATALGTLMAASHVSLRDDFEVSSPALNTMVTIAAAQPGCFGARMTGAGFGGCAVALVEDDRAGAFNATVAAAYQQATGVTPAVYTCQAADGASLIRLD